MNVIRYDQMVDNQINMFQTSKFLLQAYTQVCTQKKYTQMPKMSEKGRFPPTCRENSYVTNPRVNMRVFQ